jgi:peptidyl-prolyl cis-trans isomerase D
MLEQMHKHMKWIMWAIVVLITVTFLFFGIYPSTSSGRTVAKVDGYVIGSDDVNRVYLNMAENYRKILKDQFNENFSQLLRKQALQELIQNRLLVQEAERQGLKVSDEELQSYLMQIPAFINQAGKFDHQAYEYALRNINMTPAVFEANQREYLLRQKLERLVEDGVAVIDAELPAAYAAKNPKAKKGEFEKSRESFKQTLLAEKRREALNAYVKGLMSKATIRINEQAMPS